MIQINEWDAVPWGSKRPVAADPQGQPSRSAAPTSLLTLIAHKLAQDAKPRPMAVHFYLGEGLRWIRVGFDEGKPLAPPAVATIGRLIDDCLQGLEPLYFHALRTHDMLFFLEGGKADSIGLDAASYGHPLEDVLKAWGVKPRPR